MLNKTFSRFAGKVVAALMLISAQTVFAAPTAQFDAAYAVFNQARAGDAGAATAMRAKTTWFPWKKMGFAEDGMALLDKALAMLTPAHNAPLQHDVPAALEVRFVAANTFLAVPGFMNRGPRGAKLLQAVVDSPVLAASPLSFRENVWMVAAKEAVKDKRSDDARKYLNAVIQANGTQQQAARAQLQALAS